jgi:hypothetical protein
VFTRFSPDGARIAFSTYLGGSSGESVSGTHNSNGDNALRFDPFGNLYFTASTQSPDFPLRRSLLPYRNFGANMVLGKFSALGELLFCSVVVNNKAYELPCIDVDAAGNVIMAGNSGDGLPFLNPIDTLGNVYLAVIDANEAKLKFNTRLGNGHQGWWQGTSRITLHGQTILLAMDGHQSNDVLPPTPGFPTGNSVPGYDLKVVRLDMPDLVSRPVFHDKATDNGALSGSMLEIDTLRIDERRGISNPATIRIRCRIRNTSPTLPSDSVTIRLWLPSRTTLAPGSQPLRQVLPPVAARDSLIVEWLLLPMIDSIRTSMVLHADLKYGTSGECPSFEALSSDIPVIFKDLLDAEVLCALSVNPALKLNRDRTRLSTDTAYINVTITNPSKLVAVLGYVELTLPTDSGLTLISPLETIRYVEPILPGTSVKLTWVVHLKSWPFARPLPLHVSLVDTFGILVGACDLDEGIPGASGSMCGMSSNDPVWYRSDDASYNPRPILAQLQIYNQSDTIRHYRDLRLDLSSTQFLKFETGEQARRPDFVIEEDSVQLFEWRLRLSPFPSRDVSQTVIARYFVEADSVERSCSLPIRIFVSAPDPSCSIHCQDSLHLHASGVRFTEDSVLVTAEFRNTGSLPQPLHHATISFPAGESVEVLNGVEQPLSALPSGGTITAVWHIRVPAYPFKRSVSMTVTAYDSTGPSVTSCTDRIFAPALVLQCDMSAPDSVRYDIASGTFTPERFAVTAALHNASDTTLSNLRAILDSTMLQRAKLTASNFALQSRADLLPGETWTPRWELEATWDDRPADQRFRVLFEYSPSNATTACEIGVIIGGAPRISSLACSTAGHDSVWVDSYYEALLPDPLQVQYTLRNTGNIATPPCQLAILPPPMLLLEAGEDSIRAVPALQPGDAYAAEWLLRIDEAKVTPEPWIIRWKTECEGLSEIPACEHGIQLMQRAPIGIVLTPWLLRFEAERDGPLPATRTVQVWTGGGLTPSWTATSVPLWLDVSPLFGAGHTVMTAVPNTTSLPLGEHTDRIVLSETPISTGDVQVIYSIRTPLGVDPGARPFTLFIGSVYPNPATVGAMLAVEYRNTSAAEVTLSLHDLLGRERYAAIHRATDGGVLHVSTRDLPPGAYVLRLRSGATAAEKLVIVVP